MKTVGRMNTDSPLANCKSGEARYVKNMVLSKDSASRMSEGGVKEVLHLPSHIILCILPIDNGSIIFANEQILDETPYFRIYKWIGVEPEPILRTRHITHNSVDYIEAVYQYNNRKELILEWWNGTKERCDNARLLNIDNMPFTLNSSLEIADTYENTASELSELTLISPSRKEPVMLTYVNDGGGLIKTGKYSFSITYLLDEDEIPATIPTNSIYAEIFSNWNVYENCPMWRGIHNDTTQTLKYHMNDKISKEDELIPKHILIYLTNMDRRYKRFHLNIIHFANGATNVYRIKNISVDGDTKTIRYTGSVDDSSVSLSTILDTKFRINKIQSAAIIRDRLYIAGFADTEEYNYQKYANNIKTYIETVTIHDRYFMAHNSFLPEEVYAFYIHLVYKSGKISKGFHIPGRLPKINGQGIANELLDYTPDVQLNTPFKNFHVGLDVDSLTNTGYWHNESMHYTDWIDENKQIWDATGNTGNKIDDFISNVRYTKMPATRYIPPFIHVPGVGNTCYPQFKDIVIPLDLAPKIQGYIITYAQKTNTDMHVFGYGNMLHNSLFSYNPEPNKVVRYYGFDNLSVKNTPNLNLLKECGHTDNYVYSSTPNTNYTLGITEQHLYPIDTALYRPANDANTNYLCNETMSIILKQEIPRLKYHECATSVVPGNEYNCDFGTDYVSEWAVCVIRQRSSIGCVLTQELDLHKDTNSQTLIYTGHFFPTTTTGVYETDKELLGDCELVTDTVRHVSELTPPGETKRRKYISPSSFMTYNRIPNRTRVFPNRALGWKEYVKYDNDYYFNKYDVYTEAKLLSKLKIPDIQSGVVKINNVDLKTIIRSEPHNVETNANNWREFRPLMNSNMPNYLIMPTSATEILHLEVGNDKAYIQCQSGLYIAQFKSQITATVSLQEEDIFNIAPQPIEIGNKPIMCLHKTACKITPVGYCVADRRNRQVLLIGETIQDITVNNKELFNLIFNQVGYETVVNNLINIVYDVEYKDIIVTATYPKEDTTVGGLGDLYVPTIPIEKRDIDKDRPLIYFPLGGEDVTVDKYGGILATLNNQQGYYKLSNSGTSVPRETEPTRSDIYIHPDVMLEHNMISSQSIAFRWNNGLISYNTHHADILYTHHQNLYSYGGKFKITPHNNRVYKLNDIRRCGYYQGVNVKDESFIDIVFSTEQVKDFSLLKNIQFKTTSLLANKYVETVNSYAIYNTYQSSGRMELSTKVNALIKNVTHNYTNWNVDDFKNKLTDSNLPITDVLGELLNISNTLMWFNKNNMIDNIFVIRLYITYFENNEHLDKQIAISDIDINIKPFIK